MPTRRFSYRATTPGVAFGELVAIAHDAGGEAMIGHFQGAFHGGAPALLGVVEEFRDGNFEAARAALDFENHFDVLGGVAAQDVGGDGADVQFLSNTPGQVVEVGRDSAFRR